MGGWVGGWVWPVHSESCSLSHTSNYSWSLSIFILKMGITLPALLQVPGRMRGAEGGAEPQQGGCGHTLPDPQLPEHEGSSKERQAQERLAQTSVQQGTRHFPDHKAPAGGPARGLHGPRASQGPRQSGAF